MKKFLVLLVVIACFSILISKQSTRNDRTLYLLNWGDYMDGDLILDFEKNFGCEVKEILSESNEDMYNQIINKKYPIDVVIPSDYMAQKLKRENLLKPIDKELLTEYKDDLYDDELYNLIMNYDSTLLDYAVPYFWGTVGLMYNDRTKGLEEAIKEYGYRVLFEPDLTNKDLRIGMYNNPRDSLATGEFYLGISVNEEKEDELLKVKNLLLKQKDNFHNVKYAGDDLKNDIAGGKNLDVAVCYSGDFFDQYYTIEEEGRNQYINFFVPDVTNVYFDAMVIPITSKETDLAHEFINYFLNADNIVQNVEYVGYCPTTKDSYNKLLEDPYYVDLVSKYPFHPTNKLGGGKINGEMYRDLGEDYFRRIDQIYREVASK